MPGYEEQRNGTVSTISIKMYSYLTTHHFSFYHVAQLKYGCHNWESNLQPQTLQLAEVGLQPQPEIKGLRFALSTCTN